MLLRITSLTKRSSFKARGIFVPPRSTLTPSVTAMTLAMEAASAKLGIITKKSKNAKIYGFLYMFPPKWVIYVRFAWQYNAPSNLVCLYRRKMLAINIPLQHNGHIHYFCVFCGQDLPYKTQKTIHCPACTHIKAGQLKVFFDYTLSLVPLSTVMFVTIYMFFLIVNHKNCFVFCNTAS